MTKYHLLVSTFAMFGVNKEKRNQFSLKQNKIAIDRG